ncbi:MAG: hypothetical protein ACR2IH_01595 [Pyrinomonadaceae bacterium]
MKKTLFATVFCCIFAIGALAQAKTSDFSGTWTLDLSKSRLDERARIESMTMTVAQTAKDIKIDSKITRTPRPEGSQAGAGGGNGMGRGGGMGNGESSMSYTLDGKETTIQQESPRGTTPVKLSAKLDASTLNLASSRTFTTPNGDMTSTTKETWTLSPDGKTLTVARENATPRGTNSSTMVFVKK